MPFKNGDENREYMREYMRKRRESTVQVNATNNLNSKITELAIDLIDPTPKLIREIDGAALNDLKVSIKKHGVLQPILVRPVNDRYEIVFGNHRYYAAKNVGLKTIPVQVRQLSDSEALMSAATENIQRLEMNPLAQGELFNRLLENGYNVFMVAEQLGKSETYIRNRIDLFKNLAPELRPELGLRLGLGTALRLCKLTSEQQKKLFDEVEAKRASMEHIFDPPAYGGFGGGGGFIPCPSDKCVCPKCGSKHWKGADTTIDE